MIRSRSWLITCNYKTRKIPTAKTTKMHLEFISGLRYYCFKTEKSTTGTKHRHLFLYFNNFRTFNGVQNLFSSCHIKKVEGDLNKAINYVKKEANKTSKITEWGLPPNQGKRSDLSEIMAMSKQLIPLDDIRHTYPAQFLRYKANITSNYQEILSNSYKKKFRKLYVVFIHGDTNIGKTRYVNEKYDYDLYRVTNYKNPFDGYNCEKVIVLDEFRNSFPISEMLTYLEGYPLKLKARYHDKVACYTRVYVISNWNFFALYKKEQKHDKKTYQAFKRRFTFIGDLEAVKKYEKENKI